MSSRVIEKATGAQVLPHVRDERATVSEWAVASACSADRRIKYLTDRDLAARMEVRTDGNDR